MADVPVSNQVKFDLLRAWQGRYTRSWTETLLRILPAALYTWAIFAVSSTPSRDFPGIVIDDRIAHFVEYALLGAFLMLALVGMQTLEIRPLARALAAILIAVCVGMLDEWNQSFIPGRDSSWKDVAFDLLGASFMALMIATLSRKNESREGEDVASRGRTAS